ncbi:MAG: PTS sugar transporter subunit IIA [Candidatus Krumholzibacteriota bacterium]|nr:PTS sugar transporter subunit IIA [Candidatus Krumholzibacteriota bacterium]
MRLTDYIKPESIATDLIAEDKEEVIEELVEKLSENTDCCDMDKVYQAVMDREKNGSTGLEKGVAIPHAKCDDIDRLRIVVGISEKGIDFDSQDGKLSHIFFLMIAPSSEAGPHVQAIARIVKMISIEGVSERLIKAGNAEKLLEIISYVENGG